MYEIGEKFALFITALETDTALCQLWAQTDFDSYNKLEGLLQGDANLETRGVTDINSLAVGDVCLAKYHADGSWYRAQVLNIDKSGTTSVKLKVLFIDFGNVEVVSVQDLASGGPECFASPPLASKFLLADIRPRNGTAWTKPEITYLNEHLCNMEVRGEVLHVGTVGWPPTVRLYETADSVNPVVNTFIQLDQIGQVYDNSHLGCGSMAKTILEVGQQLHVYVTYSRSAVDFWIQPVEAAERLDQLHADIETHLTSLPDLQTRIHQGMLCMAKYSETGSFYRAVVTKCFRDYDKCEVTFIDYGNSDIVSNSDVKALGLQFCSLPAQAVHCTLSGEAVRAAKFDQLIECDDLTAKILEVLHSGVYVVVLSTGSVGASSQVSDRMTVASSSIMQRHSPGPERGCPQQAAATYQALQFDMGSRHEVCICHVEESGYFFVHLNKNRYLLDTCMVRADQAPLDRIAISLLNPQCVCLVKSPADGVIYRGEVLSRLEREVDVKYVDFGVVETVEASAIYHMPPDLMEFPVQAIYCSLTETDHLPPSQVVDLLKQYESNSLLIAKVVLRSGCCFEMEVFDTCRNEPVSLTNLAKQGISLNGNIVKPVEVAIGSEEKLFVTAVNSDTEFFGQLARYSAENLSVFGEELNAFYNAKPRKVVERVEPGQHCCAVFSVDGLYYRAQIMQVLESGGVQVSYLDYGNQEQKHPQELLVLDSSFCELPQQGISCVLGDFYTGLKMADLENWLLEKDVVVHLRQTKANGFSVTFPDCAENMAFFAHIRSHERKESRRLLNQPPPKTKSLSTASSRGSSSSISNTAPAPVEFRVPSLCNGQWEPGFVTYIESPEHFYMQLESTAGELSDLMTTIAQHCSSQGSAEGAIGWKVLGMPVLALFSTDQMWYRAVITGLMKSVNKVEVLFVDYGNKETVSPESVRPMKAEFLGLPKQAILCNLGQVSGGGAWSQADIDMFYDCTDGKQLMVLFDSFQNMDQQWKVELFEGNRSINEEFGKVTGRLTPRFRSRGPPPSWKGSKALSPDATGLVRAERQEAGGLNLPAPSNRERVSSTSSSQYSTRSSEKAGGDAPRYGPRSGCAVATKLRELNPRVEDYFNVQVMHYQDPSQFWCILQENVASLESMMDQLNDEYMGMHTSDLEPHQLKQGDPCCALYSQDEKWYRGEITMASKSGYLVYFVDYGNGEECPPANVKQLKACYATLPKQAFRCSLSGVRPPGSQWSDSAANMFGSLTDCGTKKLVGLILEKFADGSHVMELIDLESNDTVHQSLISVGLAVSAEQPASHAMSKGRGQGRRPSVTSSTSNSSMTSSLSKQATAADLKYKEVQLKVGQFVDVCVAFSVSPSLFWCQLTEHSGLLKELMGQLELEYMALQGSDLAIPKPEINQVCCAKYTGDDEWYRGLVVQIAGPDIKVKFVDYGNTEMTTVSRIKQLDRRFISVPMQAFKCALHGTDCRQESWSAEDSQKFEDLTVDQHLVAKVVSRTRDGVHLLNLVHISDSHELNINEALARKGIAKSAESQPSARAPEKKTRKSPSPAAQLSCSALSYKDMKVPVGKPHLAVASWFNSPGEFFCQLDQSKEGITQMSQGLYSSYHQLRLSDMCLGQPDVGRLCVAYYEEDGSWYRGQIVSKQATDANVFYVDYGNVEKIPLSKVKEIRPEFVQLPCQALRCELQGTSKLQGKFSPETMEKFQKLLHSPFTLTVLERIGDINVVKLIDEQGRNLAEVAGFVKPVPVSAPSPPAPHMRASPPRPQPTVSTPAFVFRDAELPLKSTNLVQISHVEGPQSFYIQLSSSLTKLEEHMDNLGQYYMEQPSSNFTPAVGKACVAQYTVDDMWYRATITDVPCSTEVTVCFVDYGNVETLPAGRVKPLAAAFQSLPVQAFKCSLTGLTRDVPSDEKKVFEELAFAEMEWTCTIDAKVNGCHLVTLAHNDNSLNAKMLSKYEKTVAPETVLSVSNTPMPDLTSKKFALAEIPTSKAEAYVITSISPTLFYVQLSGTEAAAQNLADKLLAEYGVLDAQDRVMTEVKVGQACVAKFTEDDSWYRAYVTALSGDQATVQFIDYGNSDVVAVTNIKQPTADYMNLPAMVVECRLDIDPPAGGWSKADTEKLESVTESGNKLLEVEFLGTSTPCPVHLWDGDQDLAIKLWAPPVAAEPQASSSTPPKDTVEFTPEEWTGVKYSKCSIPAIKSQVYISHIESPSELYLQLVRQENLLQEVMDKVEETCACLGEDDRKVSVPLLYQPCCAKYSEDQVWYRARITQRLPNQKVKVHFVDYGNSEITALDNIKEIPAELLETAPMAVTTSLKGLATPIEGWPDDVIDELAEMTKDKVLSAEFYEDAAKMPEVQLTDKDTIINHKVADICPAAVKLQPAVATAEKHEQNFEMLPHLDVPAGPVQVFVSAVESPARFFIQLASSENQLQDFSDKVTEVYSSDPLQFRVATFAPGQVCCAKYSQDDQWYRGVIKSKEGDTCTVLFLDYGNVEEVSLSNIAKLRMDFVQVPPYAVECRLAGLKSEVEWTDEEIEKFIAATTDKELNATFSGSKSKPHEVSLKDGDFDLRMLFEDRLDSSAAGNCQAGKTDVVEVPVESLASDEATAAGDAAPDLDVQTHSTELPSSAARRTLKVGDRVEVYISHSESPSSFWCQLAEEEDLLEELRENLVACCSETQTDTPVAVAPAVGQLCVAKYSDGEWYRAQVLAPTPDGALVRFIDFGNTDDVLKSQTKRLSPVLAQQTPFAFQCALAGLEASGENASWCEAACLRFQELTTDKKLLAEVMAVLANDGCDSRLRFAVKLMDMGQCIGQVLNSEGLAMEGESHFTMAPDPVLKQRLMSPEPEQEASTYTSDDASIPTLDFEDETKPTYSFSEEVASLERVLLVEKSRLEAYTSHVESPTRFWLQLKSAQADLNNLTESMHECYKMDSAHTLDGTVPGQYVAAKSLADEAWYRAQVISTTGDMVTVQYIDYGNQENIELANIRQLSSSLAKTPVQAIECMLADLRCPGCSWSDEAIETFQELTANKTLLVEPATAMDQSKGLACVKLLDMGVSLAEKLIAAEMAVDSTKPEGGPEFEVEKDQSKEGELSKEESAGEGDGTFSEGGSDTVLTASCSEASEACYRSTNIAPGDKLAVYVTHVESPHKFWCQLESSTTELPLLMDKVHDHYSTLGENDKVLTAAAVGKPCVAKYVMDNSWYRGEIIDMEDEANALHIRFVDYGNSQSADKSLVKSIQGVFTQLPMQAFCCSLHKIEPLGLTWDEASKSCFCRLASEDVKLEAYVEEVDRDDGGRIENVKLELMNDGKSVAEQLVDEGYAQLVPDAGAATREETEARRQAAVELTPKALEGIGTYQQTDHITPTSEKIPSEASMSRHEQVASKEPVVLDEASVIQNEQVAPEEPVASDEANNSRNEQVASEEQVASDDQAEEAGDQAEEADDQAEEAADQVEQAPYEEPSGMTEQMPQTLAKVDGSVGEPSGDVASHQRVIRNGSASNQGSQTAVSTEDLDTSPIYSTELLDSAEPLASIEPIDSAKPTDPVDSTELIDSTKVTDSRLYDHDTLKDVVVDGLSPIRPSTPADSPAETKTGPLPDTDEQCHPEMLHHRLRRVSMEQQGFTFPDIEVGTTVRVSYVCGENPSDFVVQFADTSAQLQEMMQNIAAHHSSAVKAEKLKDGNSTEGTQVMQPGVGQGCLALLAEHDKWYRAVVTSQQDNTVEVKCVDYGMQAIVEAENVQALDSEFTELAVQAVSCFLAGIESAEWTYDSHHYFEELCSGKALEAHLVEHSDSKSYAVYLYDSEDHAESINYKLVRKGFASVIPGSELDLQVAMANRDADDLENSFLDVSMQRTNSIGNLGGSETDSSEEVVYAQSRFRNGEELDVVVVSCKDPDHMVCVLKSGEQQLQSMMERLAETCSDASVPSLESPQSGQPCCVLHPKDKTWCRGQIVSVDGNSLEVYYVDHGSQEVVPAGEVKLLHQEYLSLPTQAMQCRLAGVRTPGDSWPPGTSQLLEEACSVMSEDGKQTVLKALVVSAEADNTLIVVLKTSDGQDLSRLLLDAGMALQDLDTVPDGIATSEHSHVLPTVCKEENSEYADPIVSTDETFGAVFVTDQDSGLHVLGEKSLTEDLKEPELSEDQAINDSSEDAGINPEASFAQESADSTA